jgi:Kef-type K+ transport system membrane component KefB
VSLTAVALVALVAFLVPLVVRLLRLPVPEVVLEIVLGILVGPQVLGWVLPDEPVQVFALVGLAFLLFLAGIEIDPAQLRGRLLRVTLGAYAVSFALALALGRAAQQAGLVRSPVLVAVILSATSLGIVVPILDNAGLLGPPLGPVVVAGASLAEVVPVVLVSILLSSHAGGLGAKLVLLAAFLLAVVAAVAAVRGAERSARLTRALLQLQDTTAQVRVRGALALLLLFAAAASAFGLEAILGAFLAGVALRLLDRDQQMTHAELPRKLRAVGFGVFVPFFFVSTGTAIDVQALVTRPAELVKVPLFVLALLLVRGVPALLYRSLLVRPRAVAAAGLLQATSLSLPVVAGAIGVDLGLLRPGTYAALVAAGLISVVLFPALALVLLRSPDRGGGGGSARAAEVGTEPAP